MSVSAARVVEMSMSLPSKRLGQFFLGGFEWYTWLTDLQNEDLNLFILCKNRSDSTLWSYKLGIEATVRNNNPNKTVKQETDHVFAVYTPEFETRLGKTETFNQTENGFVNSSGEIVVELKINTKSCVEKLVKSWVSFSLPREPLTDAILVVDGRRLYVTKQILAMNSKFFYSLFFSDFVEKNMEEIPIEDVDFDDFVDFLHLVHFSMNSIREGNVASLLSLADRFESEHCMRKCEKYLIDASCLPLQTKLRLAEMYKLVRLQERCFSEFRNRSMSYCKDVLTELDYDVISKDTLRALALSLAQRDDEKDDSEQLHQDSS